MKIFIDDKTFGNYDQTAFSILNDNPNVEIVNFIGDADGIIAGTDPYNDSTLNCIPNLKVISRMGVGYDAIDIDYCKSHNIMITYTPDAPSGSVAELVIGQMINMTRSLPEINNSIHNGGWFKPLGKKLSELTIGVVVVGRIGQRVISRLQPFNTKIIGYDIDQIKINNFWLESNHSFSIVQHISRLLESSDIVTVHIPMNDKNSSFIGNSFLLAMKDGSYLINTSRGGILNEVALLDVLQSNPNKLCGVSLDVFNTEPYQGEFTKYKNVLMTSHIGSMTLGTRIQMEVESVKDCIRVLEGTVPINPVPEMGNIYGLSESF